MHGTCRICGGVVREFLEFGRHPLANALLTPDQPDDRFRFRLALGMCDGCTMVQLVDEIPREQMFHEGYPYRSSGSTVMRAHFEKTARQLLDAELPDPDAFLVELGCNDGVLLETIARAGVRHLGVEPSGEVARVAAAKNLRVRETFFDESSAREIAAMEGPADVIYSANTVSHIPYMSSIFAGVDALLGPDGVFVVEDPYLGDIIDRTSFDQIYDEHFFFFTAVSVQAMAARHGFELVDLERLPVHGGEVRYTIARRGARKPTPAVTALVVEEYSRRLADPATLERFAGAVAQVRADLVALLTRLRRQDKRIVGYGATAKSSTVTNYCGIGPELISFIVDSTPEKQGMLTPGSHIPVRPPEEFSEPYPDYAVLFAWNHAEEIMAKEQRFHDAGGRWIRYVPNVHIV